MKNYNYLLLTTLFFALCSCDKESSDEDMIRTYTVRFEVDNPTDTVYVRYGLPQEVVEDTLTEDWFVEFTHVSDQIVWMHATPDTAASCDWAIRVNGSEVRGGQVSFPDTGSGSYFLD